MENQPEENAAEILSLDSDLGPEPIGLRRTKACQPRCRQWTIDMDLHLIVCDRCGRRVDAFSWIVDSTAEMRRVWQRVREAKKRLAHFEERIERAEKDADLARRRLSGINAQIEYRIRALERLDSTLPNTPTDT